ncbi:hypothetical protein HELRODRAFT_160197 [Helobdella robusta]|uniref:Uncharacterized protein n=1 Tax=Helobdella robusta TaxID=6412 RepID=T1EPY4_HELRO|nr:hypothetical protein HELRODRAFT_160197 [Helobdella robusta]ESO06067.1 hypothetical protein HELRODRAFT_160197 [Helobdella robusta]
MHTSPSTYTDYTERTTMETSVLAFVHRYRDALCCCRHSTWCPRMKSKICKVAVVGADEMANEKQKKKERTNDRVNDKKSLEIINLGKFCKNPPNCVGVGATMTKSATNIALDDNKMKCKITDSIQIDCRANDNDVSKNNFIKNNNNINNNKDIINIDKTFLTHFSNVTEPSIVINQLIREKD